jgi:predicted RNase H-like HicB family nuclease
MVVERGSEGYYVASVPALADCHTQARSLDELMGRIRKAIGSYLEAQVCKVEEFDFLDVERLKV